ncbi:hypothetical protein [Paenibacillus gansuensis]|uniref:Uncharacterized protein n=1 Tax=Paenibacillus gansuensis TaxID=306542 RepID=A0ABW5P9G1_9BACL
MISMAKKENKVDVDVRKVMEQLGIRQDIAELLREWKEDVQPNAITG